MKFSVNFRSKSLKPAFQELWAAPVKRKYPDLFKKIDTQVVEKYFSDKSLACFSMVKPSDSHRTLKDVSNDLFDLVEQFTGDTAVSNRSRSHHV